MPAKLKYSTLTFVSGNREKYQEYCTLLGISDLNFSEMPITEPQSMNVQYLVEQKIEYVIQRLPKMPFFVEHTELSIDAWKGLPGGLIRQFMITVGNEGICKMMQAYKGPERIARAKVVIGYHYFNSGTHIFQGEVTGTIASVPRGNNNFGWDPIFLPEGETKSYGEMTLVEKNRSSMRKAASESFAKYLALNFEL